MEINEVSVMRQKESHSDLMWTHGSPIGGFVKECLGPFYIIQCFLLTATSIMQSAKRIKLAHFSGLLSSLLWYLTTDLTFWLCSKVTHDSFQRKKKSVDQEKHCFTECICISVPKGGRSIQHICSQRRNPVLCWSLCTEVRNMDC